MADQFDAVAAQLQQIVASGVGAVEQRNFLPGATAYTPPGFTVAPPPAAPPAETVAVQSQTTPASTPGPYAVGAPSVYD